MITEQTQHDKNLTSTWVKCDKHQIKMEVKERNTYKKLLDECLYALDVLPDQKIEGDYKYGNTYALASEIGKVLREFN